MIIQMGLNEIALSQAFGISTFVRNKKIQSTNMSHQEIKKQKSVLWLIFPVAAGLTLLFAFVNNSLDMGTKTPVSPQNRIELSGTPTQEPMPHEEKHVIVDSLSTNAGADSTHTMPADSAKAGAAHH